MDPINSSQIESCASVSVCSTFNSIQKCKTAPARRGKSNIRTLQIPPPTAVKIEKDTNSWICNGFKFDGPIDRKMYFWSARDCLPKRMNYVKQVYCKIIPFVTIHLKCTSLETAPKESVIMLQFESSFISSISFPKKKIKPAHSSSVYIFFQVRDGLLRATDRG